MPVVALFYNMVAIFPGCYSISLPFSQPPPAVCRALATSSFSTSESWFHPSTKQALGRAPGSLQGSREVTPASPAEVDG